MKRMHVHISVDNVPNAVGFYSALFAAHRDKPSDPKTVEMKRECVGREIESFGNFAGRQAFGSCRDQQPEHIKPIVLGKRGKSRNGIRLFHISTIIEIRTACQSFCDAA